MSLSLVEGSGPLIGACPTHDPSGGTMTPTRALVGLAVAATAGYVAINSVSDQGPQYVGDFPSIMEEGQANPAPAAPGVDPGPPVPDPPHYDAQPVAPEGAGRPARRAGRSRARRAACSTRRRWHRQPGGLSAAGRRESAGRPAERPRLPVRRPAAAAESDRGAARADLRPGQRDHRVGALRPDSRPAGPPRSACHSRDGARRGLRMSRPATPRLRCGLRHPAVPVSHSWVRRSALTSSSKFTG